MTRPTRKQKNNRDDVTENGAYYLPSVFHNLKSYDARFVIKRFHKKHMEHKHEIWCILFVIRVR